MSRADHACDLCGLPLGKSDLAVRTAEKEVTFCCEGCKGIWQMLNPQPPSTERDDHERSDERHL